jgi:serine/threonine protein kinase
MLLYEMYTGHTLFEGLSIAEIFKVLRSSEELDLHKLNKASSRFRSLVKMLLSKDPQERLGALDDANELMRHQFFTDTDWEKVQSKEVEPIMKPSLKSTYDTRMFDPRITSTKNPGNSMLLG